MDILKATQRILLLFTANCVFCWILTSHWIFGPIVTVVAFVGGISLISFLGVILLKLE